MPSLGKDSTAPTIGSSGSLAGIISVTYTQECETVDISNRSNVGGTSGAPGHKISKAGFVTKTYEVECHDPSGLISSLEGAGSGLTVMSVAENIKVDGPVTYSVTLKEF